MLTLISPAKTLDFESELPATGTSRCDFLPQSETLIGQLKQLRPSEIASLMNVSEAIAELNHDRFQDWERPSKRNGARPALFAFQGDVYRGFKADELSIKQLDYAQTHLRILSGLYGMLRPMDLILPYRLEMGTKFATPGAKDLIAFWGDRLTNAVNAQLASSHSKLILNLASKEYFRSVDSRQLSAPVITPAFKEVKNGKAKMITVFAKMARGSMASWVMRKKARTLKKLYQFNDDGYRYDESLSSQWSPVFVRS
ncbi:MAG: peroxide stress protein YaaA [Planctomycetota bacterium]